MIIKVIGMGGTLAAPTHLPGGAVNAALMLASSGLANARAPKGIRINAVNPGLTATDRMQQGLEAEARLAGRSVDEILGVCAGYVSGAIVSIDGAATPMVV